MGYYQKHLFFCTNQKDSGKVCCNEKGASALCKYAKTQIKALHLGGAGGIRVSNSGCLGRCKSGPCLVIYPEGVWYCYGSEADIDRIIQEHLIEGGLVESLLLEG